MAGNDQYTVSMLHMAGASGATSFIDNASAGSHVWTPTGAPYISIATYKLGGAAGVFRGATDRKSTRLNSSHNV
jgi:hypothetical protein